MERIPRDDQWHCWEQRVKLNTTGNSDGILEFWLDGGEEGLPTASYTDVDLGATSFSRFVVLGDGGITIGTGIGIGNTAATSFQTPWRAIEFDDYVLSTSYIGPVGTTPDTTPPAAPSGVTVI